MWAMDYVGESVDLFRPDIPEKPAKLTRVT